MLAALATTASAGGSEQEILRWAIDQGGAFLVAIVCGYGWWRAEKRADVERTARNELADKVMADVIPAIGEATATQREFLIATAARTERLRDDGRRPR